MDPTTTKMQMFTVGCAWVRMKRDAPMLRQLTSLWKQTYMVDGALDNEAVKNTATGLVRMYHCLNARYGLLGDPTQIASAKDAVQLIAGVWYGAFDKPADIASFTDYVQFLFPKVDTLEIANEAAWVCRSIMLDVYVWWFPKYLRYYEEVQYVEWYGDLMVRPKANLRMIRKGRT